MMVGSEAVETIKVNTAGVEAATPVRRLSAVEFMQLNQAEQREYERRIDYERDLKRYTEQRRRYPIRCCSAKEHPSCRRWIITQGLRPYPEAEAWDGFSALDRDGQQTFLSDGLQAQMRRMIVEGYWDEARR